MNNDKKITPVQAIDTAALKNALKVRSTVRAGALVVARGCGGCGRGG